ncbi:MAG: helix-turn-helix transcriptional regulator [Phycisphaerae bacterium]|nr:helix-turn-helix transcriptional regulator [Phycisphaerae bacterium]
MEQDTNSLAFRLRSLRDKAGLTQRALSDSAGITEMAISRIENGHATNVELRTLVALAKALGVSIIDLIPEGG